MLGSDKTATGSPAKAYLRRGHGQLETKLDQLEMDPRWISQGSKATALCNWFYFLGNVPKKFPNLFTVYCNMRSSPHGNFMATIATSSQILVFTGISYIIYPSPWMSMAKDLPIAINQNHQSPRKPHLGSSAIPSASIMQAKKSIRAGRRWPQDSMVCVFNNKKWGDSGKNEETGCK